MSTIPYLLNRFDGGIASYPRTQDQSKCSFMSNFGNLSLQNGLTPVPAMEDGSSGGNTDKLANFLYYNNVAYALGDDGSGKFQIFKNTSLATNTWTALTHGTSNASGYQDTCFVEYQGYAYVYGAFQRISKIDLADVYAIVVNDLTTTWAVQVCQGLVHSKDDVLYMAYDNIIALKNGASWTATALTLPTNMVVTSLSEYGNYLAIACRSLNTVGKSIVYLWDRDSSLTTLSESIDFGTGTLQVLEQLEGQLIGISFTSTSASSLTPKVVLRYYNGGVPRVFAELETMTFPTLGRSKQKVNDRLFFQMTGSFGASGGSLVSGIWRIERGSSGFSVTLHKTVTAGDSLLNFNIFGDFIYIAASTAGTGYYVKKTNDALVYTDTSVYESLIFNHVLGLRNTHIPDSTAMKKLLGVSVMFEPLSSGAAVVLKYRKNEETSWTTIFSYSTQNAVSHSAVNIESTGANLPEYKEIQFRMESTGGAVINTLKFHAEVISSDLY